MDTNLEKRVDELNDFYCRFDNKDFSTELQNIEKEVEGLCEGAQKVTFTVEEVRRVLAKTNPCKAPGPDNVKGGTLKLCAEELSQVLCNLFNRCIAEGFIPRLEIFNHPSNPKTQTCLSS